MYISVHKTFEDNTTSYYFIPSLSISRLVPFAGEKHDRAILPSYLFAVTDIYNAIKLTTIKIWFLGNNGRHKNILSRLINVHSG